jgi:arylsulfatase A-like enzyme
MKLSTLNGTKARSLILALILALAVASCGYDRGRAESCANQERLIKNPVDFDIESRATFNTDKVLPPGSFEVIRKFDFKENVLTPGLLENLRVEDGYLKFRSTGVDPYFTLSGQQIPAEEVNIITVRGVFDNTIGPRTEELKIYFNPFGTLQFGETMKLVAPVRTDGKPQTVSLLTGQSPHWKGTITHLRVDPVETKDNVIAIHEIALLKIRRSIDLSTLEIPPVGFSRTKIGQTLQNVVFSKFGSPVEWSLTVPCEPVFQTMIALPRIYRYPSRQAFEVLVEVQGKSGTWTPVSRVAFDSTEVEHIFEGIDLKVSLSRWAGKQVTLRLTAIEDDGNLLRKGFVYWVNPYVTSRRSAPERPNIILISIDTLRADHLSLYGYPRRTSPRLDELAKTGIVFNYAISHAPWTLPSHASLFTSLYAPQHQAFLYGFKNLQNFEMENRHLPDAFVTLAERLQESGYITSGFAGGAWVSSIVSLDQGFDSWFESFELGRDISQVSEWFDRHASASFFLFLHTFEVHDYYNKFSGRNDSDNQPAKTFYPQYRGKVLDREFDIVKYHGGKGLEYDDIRFIKALYDEQILAVDEELGKLFEELTKRGLDKNTIVIWTSDHGEEFNEHGGIFHGHSLYDELVHVPLIIRYPKGLPQGRTVNKLVRLIDIYPTIMELAGLQLPEGLEGLSLLPLIRGQENNKERVAFMEESNRLLSGVQTQTAKYIYRGGESKRHGGEVISSKHRRIFKIAERLYFDLTKDPLEQFSIVTPPFSQKLEEIHDLFTAKNGGYHLLVKGPRMDRCPLRLTTNGRFLTALPRFTEEEDVLTVNENQIEVTFALEDGDVDSLNFTVLPSSAPVQVEVCQKDGKAGNSVEVQFGANRQVQIKTQWSIGREIPREAVRVVSSPLRRPEELKADMALWNLETIPGGDETAEELSPGQRDEFLQRLRALGYLE